MKINIHKTELLATVTSKKQYPKSVIPEIALVGRSNVGKSSLINRVLNRKSLARVSATPGKTATINFYSIDNALMLVDLPGYGYASRSKEEKKKWADMINEYLMTRAQLSQLILETLGLEDGDVLIPFTVNNPESAEDFWDYIYGCVLSDEEEEE